MDLEKTLEQIRGLVEQAPFLTGIKTKEDHENALRLIEDLIEDYDNNLFLIDGLWKLIEKYEETAEEFAEFNKRVLDR